MTRGLGGCRWIETQQANIKNAKVAVLYASAYGNTASLAQAISRGITKAGVGVEMVNLEQSSRDEAKEVVKSAQGFCIGARRARTSLTPRALTRQRAESRSLQVRRRSAATCQRR